MKKQYKRIHSIIQEGVEKGFICAENAALEFPKEPASGRLYINCSDHKKVEQNNRLPLREVISGSGSSTEGLSKIVTAHIKPANRAQPSFLEDTRHLLVNRSPEKPGWW